ncbi:MAG: EscU/YscU/HrcU family type III secretion system export apparatus switch protein [Succinivibrio sp.]|nr:EscU/YscU/HrcU family type III secretion system export apparatus switch protein [Succinivibrio sp.]
MAEDKDLSNKADDKDNNTAAQPATEQTATEQTATEAVGLSYQEGDAAPTVSSVGFGERAQAIVEMAKELGIYIHKDPVLLNELKNLEEGQEVPKDLFTIIATILSFSYILQGKTPEVYTRKDGSKAVNTRA